MSNKGFHVTGVGDLRIDLRSAKLENAKAKEQRRGKSRFYRFQFFEKYPSVYQLYIGDAKFPRVETVFGNEKLAENNEFKKKYIAKIDSGEEARLMEWRVVDGWIRTKRLWLYMQRRTEGFNHDRAMEMAMEEVTA